MSLWLRALLISRFECSVCILDLCLTFFPDLTTTLALQKLPETYRAGGAVLPLSGAIGGGVASFLIFLEAPQGLVLPECHCEVELGKPG